MNRKIIFFAALAILISAVGGSALIMKNMPPSNFFRQFSLGSLIEKNDSPSGVLCAKGGEGGGGGMGGGTGSGVSSYSKNEFFSCRIEISDAEKFDEAEFIQSLKKDVERDLNESDLKITKSDEMNSASFGFDYEQGIIKGRIKISGEKQEQYYTLDASLRERHDNSAK